jgi:ABC-2 type transport system ATP-binding protein
VQLTGDVDELVATHHRLTGPYRDPATLPAGQQVVHADHTGRQSTLIVRSTAPIIDPMWTVTPLDLEELVLSYMSGAVTAGRPLAVEAPR